MAVQTEYINHLTICSLNCEGVRRSADYIRDLLDSTACDVLCLQETWHIDSNLGILSSIHNNYLCTCISGIDHTTHIIRGRPHGGVAILYKKSISSIVTYIKSTNRRVCGINIKLDNISMVILSIYMPCDTYLAHIVNEEYIECIDYIESIFNTTMCNYFIGAGDYNTSFSRLNAQTTYLKDFIQRNNLAVCWEHPLAVNDNTYRNFSLNHFSCIDHYIVTKNIYDNITEHKVIDEVANLSNHNIIYMRFNLNLNMKSMLTHNDKGINSKYVWCKASSHDLDNYQKVLNNNLSNFNINDDLLLCRDPHCVNDIHKHATDSLCHSIIGSCLSASAECIPISRSRATEVTGWAEQVKPERERSLLWHWIWLDSGKPNTGFIYQIMKRTRHQYHYAIRCCKKNKLNIQKQRLAENISDSTNFWKEVNKLNPSSKVTTTILDNANGDEEITELLFTKYKTLYNSVPTNDTDLFRLHSIINSGIQINHLQGMAMNPSIIEHCIQQLKKNKDDGNHGFNSNHLIYGNQRLHILLSILFNVMLSHGYTPRDLILSTIISIPKDMKSPISNSDNYRGISLFNSISKVFDYAILTLCGDSFSTSEMQFGFKKHHSTVMCSLVYHEVISHYLSGNSNVYSCLLDASKAFDRVHFGKMFDILLTKNVPFCIVRLLFDSYTRQEARVMWNLSKSQYFCIGNGVKQGGVLSPVMFNLYIDRLLVILKETGIGCHINGTFMGALAYADDITISSPSLQGLNSMLDICRIFALDNFIIFNCKKTVCIKYGEDVKPFEFAMMNDVQLVWKNEVRHLGNFFNCKLDNSIDGHHKKSHFIGYFNKLMSNFSCLQPDILGNLFKSYCCSFYGSFLWKYNSDGFIKCTTQWNKAIRVIFSLPCNTHRWLLGPLINQYHISHQLIVRDIKTMHRMLTCHNIIVNQCMSIASINSNTLIGYKLAYFRSKYAFNLTTNTLRYCIEKAIPLALTTAQQADVDCIRMLSLVKTDYFSLNDFTHEDINFIINSIATG